MTTRRSFLAMTATLPFATLGARTAQAGEPPVFATNGIAIQGYDPVAYFTEEKPVDGLEEFATDWNGAEFRFASAENKATFDADPEKYGPQYGGYCAYAVAKGAIATTDPYAFTIYKDRLYLNFSTSVRTLWAEDKDLHIEQANENWPDVLG